MVSFRWFAAICVVLAGVALPPVLHAQSAAEQPAQETRKVAALVNGQPIYEDQLQSELQKQLTSYRRYGMRENADVVAQRLQLRILNKAIGNLLVNQEAKKRTVENLEEKIDLRVQELERKFGAGEGMERYLQIRKTTMDELRKALAVRVQIDDYLKEAGVLEPEIPEERIRRMYDADPQSFSREDTARVRHILIAVEEDAPLEEKVAARQQAEAIRKEIVAGKDFVALAKEHSACVSARNGGDLGDIRKGYMPPEFDAVAFALEPDAVSEVVETKFGFHVIQLGEKTAAGTVPYEDMRAFLLKYLQGEEAKKLLEQHLIELRKKADVKVIIE